MTAQDEIIQRANESIQHLIENNPDFRGEISVIVPSPAGIELLQEELSKIRLTDISYKVLTREETEKLALSISVDMELHSFAGLPVETTNK